MSLNWTPEVIIDIIVSILIFISAILTFKSPNTKKIKSLFFIRLGIIFISLFFLFEGLSLLFLSILFHQIHSVSFLFSTFFMFIGINYTMRESPFSWNLIPLLLFTIPYLYLIFQPGMIIITYEFGYKTVAWTELLIIVGVIIIFLALIILFYWGLKTYVNSPFLIKKEAKIFIIGITFITIFSTSIFLLSILWIPVLILLSDIFMIIGSIIFIIAIIKEPKLLYILPFTVYRISVKDRNGFPLFDHDWSKSDINETLFTGFINAVQMMSQEVMDMGGLVDIHLEEGILMLQESEYITVGLVASKSSKLLQEALINFSKDFQIMFKRELKQSCKDMVKYEAAYELIEKYFSNFPYRIITSKKQKLLLSGKFVKIPLELDNQLKSVFKDQNEYEAVKAELIKTPLSFPSEFLNFVDEFKKEIKELDNDDYKYLDWEYDEEN